MFLKYFLMKMPRAEGKFIPNSKPNNYSVKEFLIYISRKNRQIPAHTYKEVFATMTEAVEEILSEGSSITIPYFMRIAPVVKGVFDSEHEPFNASKHGIGVNCTVLPDFIRKVKKKIKVKRINKPGRTPMILEIFESETKENAVHRDYANRIKGNYFLQKKLEFKGLTISSGTNPDNRIILEMKDINLIKHSRQEIIYNIKRNFVPPDWLANGAVIALKLRYERADGLFHEFGMCSSKWIC